jgi:5-methyltetrahydrofolate--homocysteine methyltransferase
LWSRSRHRSQLLGALAVPSHGKNLVEIILKNNGYDVLNLRIPPEELIKAYLQHHPDAIGLSGLLVKSAQQMVVTASDLKDAGIMVPLLVGGAALSGNLRRRRLRRALATRCVTRRTR